MTTENHAEQQARAQLASIVSMVAALDCDYDRLEELRDEKNELNSSVSDASDSVRCFEKERVNFEWPEYVSARNHLETCRAELRDWVSENAQELADLEEAAGDCKDADEARQRIEEDALDIAVRCGWRPLGHLADPEEFYILLCTGGPSVRIIGDLDDNMQPERPRLEYQDWGTSWTELISIESHERAALQSYCAAHFFGE
jgi:hypothetical protein